MAIKNRKQYRRSRIKMRVRKVISGTADRPRMSVFRSNKRIYVQLIDDLAGVTLASAFSASDSKMTKTESSKAVGKEIAEKAKEAGIKSVIFDRNGYLYHGRVKALAEAAREAGLKF